MVAAAADTWGNVAQVVLETGPDNAFRRTKTLESVMPLVCIVVCDHKPAVEFRLLPVEYV